jgi:hypothetical protein
MLTQGFWGRHRLAFESHGVPARCSELREVYHHTSAYLPIVGHTQRVLLFIEFYLHYLP